METNTTTEYEYRMAKAKAWADRAMRYTDPELRDNAIAISLWHLEQAQRAN